MAQKISKAGRSEVKTMAASISGGQKSKRTHYLVAIEKLGIQIGWPCGVINTGIVDVANAKSIEEAQITALKRAAKKWKTNAIALRITEVQTVKPRIDITEGLVTIWDSATVDRDDAYSVKLQAENARRIANRPYSFDATAPHQTGLATYRRC